MAVHQIFLRYFDKSLCILNFDPRKINKQENVGDYDVLVYIPQEHTWVMVECKFNQTPFCMKDMKRLREEIFATEKPSHVSRIMKRYDFLQQNHRARHKPTYVKAHHVAQGQTVRLLLLYHLLFHF